MTISPKYCGAALAAIALFWSVDDVSADTEVPVDLELVLAVDVSSSVDSVEARLQRKGYVDALADREIVAAIKNGVLGKIAVTYVEWAGTRNAKVIAPWSLIEDWAGAFAFATFVEAAPRSSGHWTAIGHALEFVTPLFDGNGFQGTRRVIDISADGPNNDGTPPDEARDKALALGITINGLPIINARLQISGMRQMPNYDHYFEDCIIGGPGSFIVIADDYQDFARAIKRKLLSEIAGIVPPARQARAAARLHLAAGHARSDCVQSWDYRRREPGDQPAP